MLEDRVMLKEDRVFVVTDLQGDIPAGNELGLGLYRSDTRFLSGFDLRLNGRSPILLNHSIGRGHVATFQMVNPKLEAPNGAIIPMQTLSVRRTRFLRGGIHERVGLQNCGREEVLVDLEIAFAADFIDIFEVRGFEPADLPERAVRLDANGTGFCFSYAGADGLERRTEVIFQPLPEIRDHRACVRCRLAPQETYVLMIDVLPLLDGEQPDLDFQFETSLEDVERGYHHWHETCTKFKSDNEQLDRGLLYRSKEDLRILCDELPSGLFPTAGVPWYAVPFGRDAIVTSLQALALNPDVARGTLRYLAAHQGRRVDEFREEQPGKILHEIRFGELANLNQVPHTPFYGTVDATPLFVVLLVELLEWTGEVDLLCELLPNVFAALEWMDRYGDLDQDGFIEYSHHPLGVRNQGWKDSFDSLTEEDGSVPASPIAPVEVQAYAYRAKARLARIFGLLGRTREAERLRAEAERLRQQFEDAFWMPDQLFYAQALNGRKQQVRAVSSNAGHVLWAGIAEASRAQNVARRLMAPDMFSGWGIRTLSTQAVSYNPMSYHNGSVWPHDNSIAVAGLRRYGFQEEAELIARSMLEAGTRFSDDRLPELFCGFPRDRRFGSGPVEYLVSCNPQAWAAGTPFFFLQTLAGIQVDSFSRSIRIDPIATSLYRSLRVEGLRAAGGQLDFSVIQNGSRPQVKVDRSPEGIRVETPAP